MKIDRDKLENLILRVLNNLNTHQLRQVESGCLEFNMIPSIVVNIINNVTPIQQLGEFELYILIRILNNLKYTEYSPNDYFTEKELVGYSKAKLKKESNEKFPVVFKNVQRIQSNQWQCVVPIEYLLELRSRQALIYNPNTQRPLILIEKGERIITKVDLNQRSVKEIMTLMKEGIYFPHHITINMNKNYDTEPIFKGDDIIIESGQLDIIDGYHNYIAATRMKYENEDFQYNVPVILTHLDEQQAGMYIAQENKKNIIDEKYTENFDALKIGNLIAERINDSSDFYLYKQIIKQTALEPKIRFYDLSTMLSRYYKDVKQGIEVAKTSKKIVDFWNRCLENDIFEENHIYDIYDLSVIAICCKKDFTIEQCKAILDNRSNRQYKNASRYALQKIEDDISNISKDY